MPASTLRNLMVSKMSAVSPPHDESVPALLQGVIAEAITEYITTTVRAVGSYAGVIPPAIPESAPVDTWNITGVMPPCPVPGSLEQWTTSISDGIRSSFYYGMGVSHPLAPTIAFPTIQIIPIQSNLTSIHLGKYEDPQGDTLLEVCNWITNALQLGFLPTVPAGIAGTGIMTISSIIV